MLLADQEKRDSAKDVEEKLMRMQSLFEKPAETPSKLAEPRLESTLSHIWHVIKDETPSLKRKRSPERARETWPFQIDNTSKKCKLSHGGRYLTVESDKIISTMLVSDIQQRKSAKIHSTPRGRNWVDSSMGSEYLCAVPESRYFEVQYFLINQFNRISCTNTSSAIIHASPTPPLRKRVVSIRKSKPRFVKSSCRPTTRLRLLS